MSAKIRFLIALENSIRTGAIKRFKQALDFARREFGEIDDNFFYKILDVFKKQGKTKKGDVVPIKKQEGLVRRPEEFATRKEYEKYLDEVLGPADDVFGSSNTICLIASTTGWLSISPTVPPISTIAISFPRPPALILCLISLVM